MTEVVALILDRAARARIAHATRSVARPVFCEQVGEVWPAVEGAYARGARVGAFIVEARDRDHVPTDALIAQLRERTPAVPVLGYCVSDGTASAEILAMARAGVSGLILRGHDDVGTALRSALATARDDCAARFILRELDPVLPRLARVVVEHCVLHGRTPLTVAGVARALGVHRKTLVLRLAAAGFPQPREVIGWCRLCLAAHALEDHAVSIERIAMDFEFPSATALRNLCKRYTGLRMSEVRQNGGLACVLHLFRGALRTSDRPVPLVAE